MWKCGLMCTKGICPRNRFSTSDLIDICGWLNLSPLYAVVAVIVPQCRVRTQKINRRLPLASVNAGLRGDDEKAQIAQGAVACQSFTYGLRYLKRLIAVQVRVVYISSDGRQSTALATSQSTYIWCTRMCLTLGNSRTNRAGFNSWRTCYGATWRRQRGALKLQGSRLDPEGQSGNSSTNLNASKRHEGFLYLRLNSKMEWI